MNDEKMTATEPACPEGFDFRQLRAYVRTLGEPGEDEVPPAVQAHVDECEVCRPKWQFLLRTDPLVRRQFESRVFSIAEQVVVQEIIFQPEPNYTIEETGDWSATAGREIANQIGACMSRFGPRPSWQLEWLNVVSNRILDTSRDLDPQFVADIIEGVRGIPEEEEREAILDQLTALCGRRLEVKKVSQQIIYSLRSK